MRIDWDELWMGIARDVGKRSRCVRRQCGAVLVTPDNKPISIGYNGPAARWRPEAELVQKDAYGNEVVRSVMTMSLSEETACDRFCPRARSGGQTANYDDCVTIHAETNALLWADGHETRESLLYVYPGAPCFTCAKTISGAGVEKVFYVPSEVDAERNTELAFEYFRQSRVTVVPLGS